MTSPTVRLHHANSFLLDFDAVVVPGGWLRLGLSCDDLYVAARARDEGGAQPSWGGMPTAARPTRYHFHTTARRCDPAAARWRLETGCRPRYGPVLARASW